MRRQGMSLLVACPVILPPDEQLVASWNHRPHLCIVNGHHDDWATTCTDHDFWRAEVHAGDGTGVNIGCPPAWNLAFSIARSAGIEYVAIVSHALIAYGGTRRLGDLVEQHADERGLTTYRWWHCIVLSVALWERIGTFDDAFAPAYYEDMDYVRRLFLAGELGPSNPMPYVSPPEFVADDERAKTIRAGIVGRDAHDRNLDRYRAKWGGDPHHETYTRPWDPSSVGGTNWHTEQLRATDTDVTRRIAADSRRFSLT